MGTSRRTLLAGMAAMIGGAGTARAQHAQHGPMYERLNQPGRVGEPEIARTQRVFDSPAPRAEKQGRWIARAPLPLPRSEMAWATALNGRMHLVGGYGEQKVDRPYHHVYDPAADTWREASPLPLGANHVGVATLGTRLFAMGGFLGQNHTPHDQCFVYPGESTGWMPIAKLPRACGAMACIGFEGRIHCIGGAIGNSFQERRSVDWHLVYDPPSNSWSEAARLPTARDHTGIVAVGDRIHVIGGRVDSFHTNSNLHHTWESKENRWRFRNPLPTARSGHGSVVARGRIFCMGGEGTNKVFAQNEAYDVAADKWWAYAPMMTPRHGLGAVSIGETIYVAGGGPVMGGGFQSAVHEAFMLDG